MARKTEFEKADTEQKIRRELRRSWHGIKESEIAQATGMERRTVNNYLRQEEKKGNAEKSGWLWFWRRK
jgi:predicted transcriptional regulator